MMKSDAARESVPFAAGQLYAVDDLTKLHGLTVERALRLIEQHGNKRRNLDPAIRKLKAKLASH